MKNHKTTIFSIITATAAFISYNPDLVGGEKSIAVRICHFIIIGGLAAFGIAAKDA